MKKMNQLGFTLVEIIVVIGVFITLFAVSTIALTSLIPEANFVTTHQSILSDIKIQQLKAMVGDTNGSGDGSAYGIYFENNQYTLFAGPAYNPSATDNVVIPLTAGLAFTSITFPSGSLVFLQNSGEVSGFGMSTSSVILSNTNSGEQHLIDINKLGTVLPE